MIEDSFIHEFADGEKAKFTIMSKIINGVRFYYAHLINIELDVYKNLSPPDKILYYGMQITNGSGRQIYYRDLARLKNDILTKYGNEWLETEI